MTRAPALGARHGLGTLARRGHGRRGAGMSAYRDARGRPVVVVTGMGVLSSLGQGQEDNWRALTGGVSGIRRISRVPDRRAAHDDRRVPSISCRSRSLPPRRSRSGWPSSSSTRRSSEAGIGAKGDFPGPLFLALPPVEIDWPQRLALAARRREGTVRLRRAASAGPRRGRLRRATTGASCSARSPSAWPKSFGFKGSPIATSTACASGATAIQLGVEAIRRGETGVALCAGTDASITPGGADPLLPPLRAVDAQRPAAGRRAAVQPSDRDGFVMAEGAGALVLESLDHATARGARSARRHRGLRREGGQLPPHALEPGRAADHRLPAQCAGRCRASRPDEVQYINAHGTSTPENDKMEWLGVSTVFGERRARDPDLLQQVDDRPHADGGRRHRGGVHAADDAARPHPADDQLRDARPGDARSIVVPNVARDAR